MKNTIQIFLILGLMLCATGIEIAAQTCAPAPVGLISWWNADGNALDSRSRKNGTLTGTTFVAGQNGQGIRFAAPRTTDNFSADGSGALDITGNQVTIEAWIKLENNSLHPAQAFTATIGKTTFPNDQTFNLLFEGGALANGTNLPANQWLFEYILTNSAGTRVHNQVTNVIVTADGNYHHFALTYDGADSPTNNVKLYIDGVLQTTNIPGPHFLTGNLKSSPAEPFTISTGISGSPFSADEVSVYNRALSTPEIAAIAGAGTAGKCKPTATTAPSGQVAWFAGDGNAGDIAGTNNGTLQNGATFAVGKVGQSFKLDGTDDFITVPTTNLNFGANDFSVDLWFNQNAFAANGHTLFGKTLGSFPNDQTYLIETIATNNVNINTVRFLVRGTSANENDLQVTIPLSTNNWNHLVAVRQGNTNRLYLNGLQIGQQTAGSNVNTGTGGAAFIGRLPELPARFYNGQIDELSLYNRALTDAEITSVFNAGIAGKLKQNATVDTNSVVSLWQGEGNASDTRGANNGTFAANTFAPGKVGQAFRLDGTDDSVNFGSLPPIQNFSFEAWVNPSSAVDDSLSQELIVGQASFGGQMVVRPGTNGGMRVVVQYRDTLNSFAQLSSGVDIPLNRWSHLNGTYDGATLKLYINGLLNAQSNPVNTTVQTCNTPYFIGGFQSATDCNGVTNPPFQFFNGLIDEAAVYNRALTAAEVRANYEAGNALSTVVGDARITFPAVTSVGTTQQIPLDAALFPAILIGTSTGLAYDIATSSVFTGNPTVCFNLPAFTSAQFTNLRMLHFEGGAWINRTAAANIFPSLCTEPLASLSPFAIVQMAPSAAEVSVGGRVVTAAGRGISKTHVTLSDSNGNIRTVITGTFGYYEFYDVPVGETYTVSVRSKRYQFDDPTRTINVMDELSNVDFTALP